MSIKLKGIRCCPGSFYWKVNTAADPNEQPQLSHMKERKGGWNRAGERAATKQQTLQGMSGAHRDRRQTEGWKRKWVCLESHLLAGYGGLSVNLAFGMKKQEHSEFKASPPPKKNKNKIKSHLLNISDHFFLFIHLLIYFALWGEGE